MQSAKTRNEQTATRVVEEWDSCEMGIPVVRSWTRECEMAGPPSLDIEHRQLGLSHSIGMFLLSVVALRSKAFHRIGMTADFGKHRG